ncbi:MAG: SDR family NAD(P)-dependent oxidoreductase [Leptolyngbya sp. SIO4C5]|uniref:SDR family NAD(P)-dependent oxidoreductase n=1 Tax=Sphaerothrix gracilis TaxID=3151835 RepID=UPI0013BF0020|nr:SDR family NAD(P)-dependent oxidoreductase [Leptolyngbya sp. SIO4C5]
MSQDLSCQVMVPSPVAASAFEDTLPMPALTGRLTGKVAIITCVDTPFRAGIAQRFGAEGAHVVVNGQSEESLHRVVSYLRRKGCSASSYLGNLAQPEHALHCVQTAIRQYGQIDSLICGAEPPSWASLDSYLISEFDQVLDILRSTFLMIKYSLPYLKQTYGSIIAIASETSLEHPEAAPYGLAMQAWITAFIERFNQVQSHSGIRAHCLCSKLKHWNDDLTPVAEPEDAFVLPPEEVSRMCAYLASEQGRNVSGARYFFQSQMFSGFRA